VAKRGWLLIIVLLVSNPGLAAEQKKPVKPSKPDPALLEFLGSWQGSDGSWVDPMTFARIDPGKLAADKNHHEGKPLPAAKEPPPRHADDWEQSP
jgi:hypothetical protein